MTDGTGDLGSIQDRTFSSATAATASSFAPQRRLSASQLVSYLDRRAFAVVGSTRPDGRPHAAMSSYVRRGSTFWLPTVAGAVRERNVRGQPWLTLVVAEGDREEHVVVSIEGPAELVSRGQVPADVRVAVDGDWISSWIRLTAKRVLSYAAEAADLSDPGDRSGN